MFSCEYSYLSLSLPFSNAYVELNASCWSAHDAKYCPLINYIQIVNHNKIIIRIYFLYIEREPDENYALINLR